MDHIEILFDGGSGERSLKKLSPPGEEDFVSDQIGLPKTARWRLLLSGRGLRSRRRWCGSWLGGLRRCLLYSRQNGTRSRCAAPPHGNNRQRNRGHHEKDRRPGGCSGKRGGGSPRTERRLAPHTAERGRDITALAALQQHHDDQEEAHNNVYRVDQANQNVHLPENQTGSKPAFLSLME